MMTLEKLFEKLCISFGKIFGKGASLSFFMSPRLVSRRTQFPYSSHHHHFLCVFLQPEWLLLGCNDNEPNDSAAQSTNNSCGSALIFKPPQRLNYSSFSTLPYTAECNSDMHKIQGVTSIIFHFYASEASILGDFYRKVVKFNSHFNFTRKIAKNIQW